MFYNKTEAHEILNLSLTLMKVVSYIIYENIQIYPPHWQSLSYCSCQYPIINNMSTEYILEANTYNIVQMPEMHLVKNNEHDEGIQAWELFLSCNTRVYFLLYPVIDFNRRCYVMFYDSPCFFNTRSDARKSYYTLLSLSSSTSQFRQNNKIYCSFLLSYMNIYSHTRNNSLV